MEFKLEISRDNVNYYDVDLFPEQQLDYDLDFYDSLEIDKVKLPFYTKIRIPLTANNKASNRFNFDPLTSTSADFPKDDFYFTISVFGSSVTEIGGILNIKSFEYNSAQSYIEVELKDYLSKYLTNISDLKLGTLYGSETAYYRNRHTFADFLNTTASGGEAGTIGQNPDPTRPISFPYVDFCNDVDGKFGYAARQFMEYGAGLNRTGIMPVFSVPKFLEYIGLYLDTASFPLRVDSKLFGIGNYAGSPAFADMQPEKLHMVIPSQLLAKQDVNRRNFSVRQSPAWAGTNKNLDYCGDVLGTQKLIKTDWFGHMETAGNYGTDGEGDPVYAVEEWGADKRMGFYPYDTATGFDDDGIRGYFCPKVSFNSSISFNSGQTSATLETIKYEIPVIQDDKMVVNIDTANANSDMTFGLYIGIYVDGVINKKIRLQDGGGNDLVLNAQGARTSQGYSNKNDYTTNTFDYYACSDVFGTGGNGAIFQYASNWIDVLEFESITAYLPQNEELFVYGGSRYSINYFLEPLDGSLVIEYVDNYQFTPPSGGLPAFWSAASITPSTFEAYDIKKAITRIGEPDGSGEYGQLNIKFTSNADTFLYKTDDEFSIEDSINDTCPLKVSEILPEILKRFECGLFYEYDDSSADPADHTHVLRIDPLHIARSGSQDINNLVDDLKSVKIFNGGDKVKTLTLNNKDYDLYFDDFDNDGVTIGSTTQDINQEGITEIKIDLNSSIYYRSVCGEEGPNYDEVTNYKAFSQNELGFTENIFTPNKDVGLRFAYLDKPLYKTNLLVPYVTLKGFGVNENMVTDSQIIFSNNLSAQTTNIGGQHIFNGRLFSYNTAGWSLMFEDEDGSTTDSYDSIFAVSEKILQSENPRIEFDMVVPTSSLASLDFFLQTLSATRFTSNGILVKSASGEVFNDNAYLTIEGILQ